jgi:esterase/lipase superfamily enzyme
MIEALEYLEESGCRRVHMFGHSMGARAVAGAAERLGKFFPEVPAGDPSSPAEMTKDGNGRMILATMTFLSPDMDYGDFVGRCGPILRSVCPLVTIYGDSGDSALGISAASNKLLYRLFPKVAAPGLKEEACAPASLFP